MPLDHSSCSHEQTNPRNSVHGHGHSHGQNSTPSPATQPLLGEEAEQQQTLNPAAIDIASMADITGEEEAPLLSRGRVVRERQGKVGSLVLATGLAIHSVIEVR
jgi:hypothetical protein